MGTCSSFRDQLIIDIRYVNKQTHGMYINKQTTVKAGFNPNSIKSFINVKTTFKNIFNNLINIDFIIFYLQMSIKIGKVCKQITIMVGFKIDLKNIINNINTTLLRVFLFITDVDNILKIYLKSNHNCYLFPC